MHVARLREKLRDDAADPRVLRTVRGKGYLLSVLAEGVEQEG
jgi:DNA-binding response OmpR family regulator